ncbi:hypothetical protein SAMN05428642_102395 [Flaviramulus basaltis]|uniref:Uncharacterized protein n=1 Tax=Flaviramulus basaltis TaxID=369401 RepID=A0A1K2IHD4_9FLAO|nr:hypothetical protein [Flaviramulus basaltis]SFZ91860.1 hypothetical protein SAMN05428642_102395 [Flaviramulus basaltis]
MKHIYFIFISLILFSSHSQEKQIKVDQTKHADLIELETTHPFKTLYSDGQINHAKKQSTLIDEAYLFLSKIMGPKKDFYLLVIASKDWEKNAYSPISGMPGYYKGNLIVGAEKNDLASGYEEMINSFPEDMTTNLVKTYTNNLEVFDMSLFFDKLSIHELTHNFQDPENQEGYSISRWLEEIHANMGLYAFYKTKHPKELKYITSLVDFSINNPPPYLQYTSLQDFDAHYYEMDASNYGFYQMKFTHAAQIIIDKLGNAILKPLNNFIIKYNESWKDKLNDEDLKKKLATEVDPYFLKIIDGWSK